MSCVFRAIAQRMQMRAVRNRRLEIVITRSKQKIVLLVKIHSYNPFLPTLHACAQHNSMEEFESAKLRDFYQILTHTIESIRMSNLSLPSLL